jgi:TDG/mug DNA glycosylase family protein
MIMKRPSPDDLDAARGATIPDVLPPRGGRLAILFCGINPSLYSGATGRHFARPGNRFWPVLYAAGLVPRPLGPDDQEELPAYGLGITNLAARATARADELTTEELRDGRTRLEALVEAYRPDVLAIAGVTAYRTAFARPHAAIGPQDDRVGGARVWVLPNPSGLNASWTMPKLVSAFAEVRASKWVTTN